MASFLGYRPLVPYPGVSSVLTRNRLEQLTIGNPQITAVMSRITTWLDEYPSLTLYTVLPSNFYEYPLFRGNRIVPLQGQLKPFDRAILKNIDQGLLLYDRELYTDFQAQDRDFGSNFAGRVINES